MPIEFRDVCPSSAWGLHWFAVATAPRHEKRAAERLADREFEVFLPVSRQTRHWKHRRPVDLEIPLFTGYLFVRIAHSLRGKVLGTLGVNSIVGNGRQSLPIPDNEIDALRSGLLMQNPEPHPMVAVGDRVLINSGPFAGFEGVLLRQRTALRVVIAVQAIMQAFSVEIELKQLTPMPNPTLDKGNILTRDRNLLRVSSFAREGMLL